MYLHYIKEFCKFSKLDPNQLVSLAGTDKPDLRLKIAEFHQDYRRRGYSSNTAHNAYMSIRSFFCYNDIRFGRFAPGFRGETQYESQRIFERSEVFRMLLGARTPRDKAIVSFVAQSGQRVGVMTNLRYGDVRRQIEKAITPLVIDVDPNTSKNRVHHSFAIGKECVDLIKVMIKVREEDGEPIDDRSFLFRSFNVAWKKIRGKFVPGGAARRNERGAPLATKTVAPILRNAAAGGGLPLTELTPRPKFPHAIRFEIHPHAFRRWWKNAMRKGGVTDPIFLNFMLGHRMLYKGAYDGFDHDYIRKEYAKAEPQVTFLATGSKLFPDTAVPKPQRVVQENELEPLLAEGWRFVTTLPSGRIVVQVGS
jgi:integrase